eukprot:XP_011603239.1 PREDICTED: sushi domain-containing protein 2 [Takifugu rubripes]
MERFSMLIFVLLVACICRTLGNTCERQCGKKLFTCSCEPTCKSLKTCCADYSEFCVEISPYSGSIMGGTEFVILNATFNNTSNLVCRFHGNAVTEGYVDGDRRGHCVSPLLYRTGLVSVEISSDNGTTFSRTGTWLSVHTGKLDSKFKAAMVNSTQWQYYGTPNVGGTLNMTWNPSLVRADKVNIELWGYRETGEPYETDWRAEWKYLYTLAKDHPNTGSFSFVPKPGQNGSSSWELGSVRVSSNVHQEGKSHVQAVWTEDHALAWQLEEKFRQNSSAWALDKCLAWDKLEERIPSFIRELIDCPCTLAQARADTGRFHTDYGCDIEKGSVCTYHPGAVHCVRAIQASPLYGAGQQCCYDSNGTQVLTGDSIGGSTPDRAHDWGSPPYDIPPHVPGQSHWVYDVLSFYYCCLWSDNCQYYFKHRPSSDCRQYKTPSTAVVFGDPHFVTFDGVSYSFNGRGEYNLVTSESKQLSVQGRTEPVSGTINATKLTAVAMKESYFDIVEVRLASDQNSLEVLRDGKSLSFSEQSWIDLNGVSVFSPSPTNVTAMFRSGAGVEVRLREGIMTTTVLLPESFKSTTLGLLGRMNGDPADDLTLNNGQVVQNQSNPEEVFSFGVSCAITQLSSLFTYDTKYLLDTYASGPKHHVGFIPVFSIPENPNDPLANETSKICSGEGSQFCRYDILVGRSPSMGNASRASFQSHISLMKALAPVAACGYVAAPANGEKLGVSYVQGAKLTFSCNDGYTLQGSQDRVCQENGQWSGEMAQCVGPSNTENLSGIIAGSVIGGIVLILIITMAVLYCKRQSRKSKAGGSF